VLSTREWSRALRVALYVALPDELPTDALLRAVLGSRRTLLLPRSSPSGIEFAAERDLARLRPGRSGAEEPGPEAPAERLRPEDLVLAPGVAFDRRGGRLGRGIGAYDRVLAERPRPICFGLAFAFQLVEAVPLAPHDQRVDAVVTELELVRAGATRDRALDPG
jgi:5-formyltetrahydrofolate cyclo-ligase